MRDMISPKKSCLPLTRSSIQRLGDNVRGMKMSWVGKKQESKVAFGLEVTVMRDEVH